MLKQRAIIQLKGQSLSNENVVVVIYTATIMDNNTKKLNILENIIDTQEYQNNKDKYIKEKQDFEKFVFSFIDLIPEDNSIIDVSLQNTFSIQEGSINPFE